MALLYRRQSCTANAHCSPSLKIPTEAAIRDALVKPRNRAQVTADVRDMRARIANEKGTNNIWDLKQVRGGLVDLEFIAQHLQLIHAANHPGILDQNTLTALTKLEQAGLLPYETSLGLRKSGRLLHDLGQVVRLCIDHPFEPKSAPGGLKELLAKAVDVPSFEQVEMDLKSALSLIYQSFEAIVV